MEKRQFRGPDRPHTTEQFSPCSLKTGTDWLFHGAVEKQQGASALQASDT